MPPCAAPRAQRVTNAVRLPTHRGTVFLAFTALAGTNILGFLGFCCNLRIYFRRFRSETDLLEGLGPRLSVRGLVITPGLAGLAVSFAWPGFGLFWLNLDFTRLDFDLASRLILDLAGLECFDRGFWVFGFTSSASASSSSMVRLAPARLRVFSTPPACSPAPHSLPKDPRARSDQETQPYYHR